MYLSVSRLSTTAERRSIRHHDSRHHLELIIWSFLAFALTLGSLGQEVTSSVAYPPTIIYNNTAGKGLYVPNRSKLPASDFFGTQAASYCNSNLGNEATASHKAFNVIKFHTCEFAPAIKYAACSMTGECSNLTLCSQQMNWLGIRSRFRISLTGYAICPSHRRA